MQEKKQGLVLWFTGIPSSGKTTLANYIAEAFNQKGLEVEVLDSDDIRQELSPDLGFTPQDRDLSTKRIAWIANLLARHGVAVMISSGASSRNHRERARQLIENLAFVYVKCPVDVCISRGGLYAKVKRGEFSGRPGEAKTIEELYKPYQEPINPEITVDTSLLSIKESVELIMSELELLNLI